MTLLAVGNPPIGKVVGIGGLRQLILVTDFALGWCAAILTGGGSLVAAFAGGDGVSTDQRKARVGMFSYQTGRLP